MSESKSSPKVSANIAELFSGHGDVLVWAGIFLRR